MTKWSPIRSVTLGVKTKLDECRARERLSNFLFSFRCLLSSATGAWLGRVRANLLNSER